MKYVLQFIGLIILGLIGYGFFRNHQVYQSGDKFIGLGVLTLAFLLMPLFIYHRYKDKKIEDFMFKNDFSRSKNSENQ
jgi:Na+/phosphate symporter